MQMSFLSSKRTRKVSRKLEIGQLYLNRWDGDIASNPGNDFQGHEGQKKMIWCSQHGFMKMKLQFANLIAFNNEVISSVDDRVAVDAVYSALRRLLALSPVTSS